MANANTQRKKRARARAAQSNSLSRMGPSKKSRAGSNNKAGNPNTAMTLFRPKVNYQQVEAVTGSVMPSATFRGRRGGKSRGSRTPANPRVPPIISAYIDPWAVDADGVRYPDNYRGFSGTFSSTFELSLTTAKALGGYTDVNMSTVTPTAGTGLWCFSPDPSNVMIQGVAGIQSAGAYAGYPAHFSWPNGINFTGAQDSPNAFGPGTGILDIDYRVGNYAALRELYAGARLVAGGVKVASSMNFSTVSGTVHMAPVFVNFTKMTDFYPTQGLGPSVEIFNGWQVALPQNLTDMNNLPGYMEFPLSSLQEDEIVGIFRRFGEEALLFKPTTTTWGCDDQGQPHYAQRYGDMNSPDSIGHYLIVMYIDGVLGSTGAALPAETPLVELQMKLHYECQANPSSSLQQLVNTGTSGFAGFDAVSGGLCTPSPPSQPLLYAAACNLAAEVPPVRCVDAAGVEEEGFVAEVVRLWKSATAVASTASAAVTAVTGALSLMAI